jgi:hypothetical protein
LLCEDACSAARGIQLISNDPRWQVTQWCQEHQYAHLQASAREDIGVRVAVEAIAALALETKAIREERLKTYSRSSSSHNFVDFDGDHHKEASSKSCC